MDVRLLRAAYDREAARYDARFLEQQRPKFAAVAREIAPPSPGERVLDLGGGTGLLASELIAREPAWGAARIVVADLSGGMLERALSRGLQVVAADARRLPFRRAAFTRVLCVTGLVEPDVVEAALTSVCRVLAPGGLFALSLRPSAIPEAFDERLPALPLDLLTHTDVEGDRLLTFRRR